MERFFSLKKSVRIAFAMLGILLLSLLLFFLLFIPARLRHGGELAAAESEVEIRVNEEKAALASNDHTGEIEVHTGVYFPVDSETISLAGYSHVDLDALRTVIEQMRFLKEIDLTACGFSNDELSSFRSSLQGIEIKWSFFLCGVPVTSLDTEIDLSNVEMEDTSAVESSLKYFSRLEKVIMCDCGLSDETMDALNRRYDDIRFVWMVYFGGFWLRTDATTFIATTWTEGYTYLTNDELWPLQYCTDLIALDLGHMHYSDASFLWSLPKLQYLILVESDISDISWVTNMPDLYYFEIFGTQVKDISPLLQCHKLKHLNIAYCPISNADLLTQLPQLERLWASGIYFGWEATQTLRKNLGADFYMVYGSATGGTWRTDEAYYEMRDVFGVYYMPG